MKVLRKTVVSVLIVLFLSTCLCYGQDVAMQDEAITELNKAIEMNPKHAEAYYNRGIAYYNKGQHDKAIADYNKAIEINPKHIGAYNNRAVVYYYKGEHDKAWEDVHKAQSLGHQVHPKFLKALSETSGREK